MLPSDEGLKELNVISLKKSSKHKLRMTIYGWEEDCKRKEGGCQFCATH